MSMRRGREVQAVLLSHCNGAGSRVNSPVAPWRICVTQEVRTAGDMQPTVSPLTLVGQSNIHDSKHACTGAAGAGQCVTELPEKPDRASAGRHHPHPIVVAAREAPDRGTGVVELIRHQSRGGIRPDVVPELGIPDGPPLEPVDARGHLQGDDSTALAIVIDTRDHVGGVPARGGLIVFPRETVCGMGGIVAALLNRRSCPLVAGPRAEGGTVAMAGRGRPGR